MKQKTLLTLFTAFHLAYGYSQMQFPSDLKWKKMESEHYSFIYTIENEETVRYGINLLEHAYPEINRPLKIQAKKIPVILKSETVYTNGYVTLAPRHMAWYITPFQDVSSTLDGSDWITNLSLHEGRHIAQFDKLDYGFTDFAGDIAGDLGKSLLINISMPYWFFEGDAVQSETKNSLTGRGRTPSFFKEYRSLENENIRYSYNKMYFGSYKHFTPDIYRMGYLMTSHVNKNYGEEVWPDLLNRVSARSYSPFSFSRQLKKLTGNNLKKTYQNTLEEFDSIWSDNENPFGQEYPDFANILKKESKYYTNYLFPACIPEDSFIAMKSGMDFSRCIVLIQEGKEKKLVDLSWTERIHTNGKTIVWAETFYDIRWGERSYSDIMVYNLSTGQKKRLTKKQKLFAPSVSPDNSKIAAIEFTSGGNCSIVVLDAKSGNVCSFYHLNKNEFARMPSWSEDGKKIVVTVSQKQDKSLVIYDTESHRLQSITPPATENISNPVFYGKYILYNTPISGIDEIHAIDTQNYRRFRVIHSKYGVYNSSIDFQQNDLVFQEYTVDGFKPKTIKLEPDKWFEIAPDNFICNNYLLKIFPVKPDSILDIYPEKDSNYFTETYQPIRHALLIHSWHPVYNYKSIGMRVYSNDLLNTTTITGGIDYYPKEMAHRELLNISYAGLFPVFSTELSYGQKYNYMADTTNSSAFRKLNEKLIAFRIGVPLDLSRGAYINTMDISASYLYAWNKFKDADFYLFADNQILSAVNLTLQASSHKQMTTRELYPKTGQEVFVNYTRSVGQDTYHGERYTVKSKFFFPGLVRNHSFRIGLGYEKNEGDYIQSIYLLNDITDRVRGYSYYNFEDVKRTSVDYSFPILHPDLNLGAFMFMKRIHGSLFYDRGDYSYRDDKYKLESAGIDLNFETYLFRLPVAWELGVRYSRKLNDNTNSFEFLLLRNAL